MADTCIIYPTRNQKEVTSKDVVASDSKLKLCEWTKKHLEDLPSVTDHATCQVMPRDTNSTVALYIAFNLQGERGRKEMLGMEIA